MSGSELYHTEQQDRNPASRQIRYLPQNSKWMEQTRLATPEPAQLSRVWTSRPPRAEPSVGGLREVLLRQSGLWPREQGSDCDMRESMLLWLGEQGGEYLSHMAFRHASLAGRSS